MLFFIITATLLFSISLYLGYRVWYLAGIVADLQEQNEDTESYIESIEMINQYMYTRIVSAHENMNRVDTRGAFAAEDEVGTTFDMLKEIIETLKEEFDGTSQEK
jgi:cell division protein FtsB